MLKTSRLDLLKADTNRVCSIVGSGTKNDQVTLTFPQFSSEFRRTRLGKDVAQYHVEDLEREEGVWSMTQRLSDSSALKVCVGILVLITTMSLLEVDVRDTSIEQSLIQMDRMAADERLLYGNVSSSLICKHVALLQRSHNLKYLYLDGEPFITFSGSGACVDGVAAGMQAVDHTWEIEQWLPGSHIRDSALLVTCYPYPQDCPRFMTGQGSISVVDFSSVSQGNALLSFIVTLTIVVLLLVFVAMLNKKMTTFTRTILQPLRWLVDDMMAISSLELLEFDEEPEELASPEGQVVELQQLQDAFKGMRSAIRSWSMYVPPCVVQRLYDSGVEATIGVAKCHATILFCDIDGFEATCQDLIPENVIKLLAAVLDKIADVIHDRNGTLLEFIGDEVLAVFNTPNALGNHASAGVEACMRIHDATRDRAEILGSADMVGMRSDIAIRCRCGVNTARILAGNIGSPKRMKYGLLGDGINLAARLKGLNSRYGTQTLISESVVANADFPEGVISRPVDIVAVKGRTEPTTVYEALFPLEGDTALPRAAQLHTEAFKMYQARRFLDARKLFEKVSETIEAKGQGPDASSNLLRARCTAYIKDPPPADWDGVDRLTAKTFAPPPTTEPLELPIANEALPGKDAGEPSDMSSNGDEALASTIYPTKPTLTKDVARNGESLPKDESLMRL